jgi:hypothetical protein
MGDNKTKQVKAVEIRAEVKSVKTRVDHTVDIVLNLPEDCLAQASILLGWQGDEVKAVIENVT